MKIRQALAKFRESWVVATRLAMGDTPDTSLYHCYTCYRNLKEWHPSGVYKILTCPHWHYAVIILAGPDLRGNDTLVSALPDVRAMAREVEP